VDIPILPPLLHQEIQRYRAFAKAKQLTDDKGIINLGAGVHRGPFAYIVAHSSEVTLNVDITPDGVSNFMQWDLNETPYPFEDKEFDVCFASHILEHLTNWQGALDEMERIADCVIIALPHPIDITAVLNPNHKQHFSFATIRELTRPNVFVFY